MAITHIVAFKFPVTLEAASVDALLADFIALKVDCKKSDGQPYIVDIKGGRNVSIEKMGKDFTFTVVVTFASKSDRDYYVKDDPVHQAFAEKAKAVLEDAFVFDFES